MQKTLFLYLIIFTLFSTGINSQNLTLKINGETTIETKVIDSLNYKKFHKDYVSIKNEIDSVQNILLKIGYIENELNESLKINDSVFSSTIHLKKKYNTIYIYYDNSQIDINILNLVSDAILKDYFIIKFSDIENVLGIINSKVSEKGFPFSKLKLTQINSTKEGNLSANLTLDSNQPKRIINNIIIKGYYKFPMSYLKYYLKIKPSQTFNLEAIKNKSQKLRDLRFASESKAPEVLFSKDSTTLYLYLNKAKSNSFDGFLGFGTNEKSNKLEFNGYLDLNLTNNLNYGESFKLLYKGEQNEQKLFETNLSLPYLLKSPIGIDVMLRIFKRDSSFTTVNQSAKLHYQINSKHKISTGILNSQSSNLLQQNTTLPIFDYKSNYYSLGYQFLNRTNTTPLFPLNSGITLDTNFGKRTQLITEENQYLITFDAFKIFNLDQKNSIYCRINSAIINSNTYLENELLRFGGINSIRGFEENSIYGTIFGVINSEYRFQLNNNIYIHSITDVAYFENKITFAKEKLYGFGFGFGLLSNNGLFKLNYALGHTENQDFNFSNYKIQIGFISSF